MTRFLAVLLLLVSIAFVETAYTDQGVEFCSAYDDRINEVRKLIAEEKAKDSVDFYYLKSLWSRLDYLLEQKVSCLQMVVETYRQTANECHTKSRTN